jgi:hypothetical protein
MQSITSLSIAGKEKFTREDVIRIMQELCWQFGLEMTDLSIDRCITKKSPTHYVGDFGITKLHWRARKKTVYSETYKLIAGGAKKKGSSAIQAMYLKSKERKHARRK